MGNRFHAYLAGRIATEPTLGATKDGRAWTMFRLAADDRLRSAETGEWRRPRRSSMTWPPLDGWRSASSEHCTSGDAVIAHGEFRFRSYEDATGTSRLGASFVASRIGPDLLFADVTVARTRERHSAAARPDPERAADLPSSPAPSEPVARRPAL